MHVRAGIWQVVKEDYHTLGTLLPVVGLNVAADIFILMLCSLYTYF